MEIQTIKHKATVVLIPYKNRTRFRKILAEVKVITDNILVIDNNRESIFKSEVSNQGFMYAFNGNAGGLAGATNMAIKLCKTEYLVYLCTNHIHIYDDTWLDDLVEQMDALPDNVVMGGDLIPYKGRHHILFRWIARTDFLKQYPYDAKNYPFSYMDVFMSDKIIKKGFKMVDLERMKSTMAKWNKFSEIRNAQNERFKIVHGH